MLSIPKPFNRLNDVYFKYLLASPERKDLTINFLNAVLNHLKIEGEAPILIEDIEFLDRETILEIQQAKGSRFDVFARSVDGRIFHIEVQNMKEKFFLKRSFFYAVSDYMMQAKRGVKYDNLEPVIFIGLMNFNMDNLSSPDEWYTLHRVSNVITHKPTFREVEFHMIELPKFRHYLKKSGMKPEDDLEELLCYFGNVGGKKFMEEIAERNEMIARYQELERLFDRDPIEIRNFLINERMKVDYQYNLEDAREEGLEEGRKLGLEQGLEQGIAQAQAETARNLRLQGILSDEQIAQVLNIPVDLVAKL